MWTYHGQRRPDFAEEPGPGQESVWDYPRPPRIVPDSREVVVRHGKDELARTVRGVRVLETASPPTFYIPPEDVSRALLVSAPGSSFCEWKGRAVYFSLASAPELGSVGWSYPEPTRPFQSIRGYLSFYPAKVSCFVDGERVRPQPGGFYGGWVTSEIVGPFKGKPGTGGW
jgi:uncharacterized protein (DUF427 family)